MIKVFMVVAVIQAFMALLFALSAYSKTLGLEDMVLAMGPHIDDSDTEWRNLMAVVDTATCDDITDAELARSKGNHPSAWPGEES